MLYTSCLIYTAGAGLTGTNISQLTNVTKAEVPESFMKRSDEWVVANKIEVKALKKMDAATRGKYKWVEETTLLITRHKYANLFLTVTDWYSAYVSSRITSLPNQPQLVFIDGHYMV